MPSHSGELVYGEVIIAILTSRLKNVADKLCVYMLQRFSAFELYHIHKFQPVRPNLTFLCSSLQDRDKDNIRLASGDENGL